MACGAWGRWPSKRSKGEGVSIGAEGGACWAALSKGSMSLNLRLLFSSRLATCPQRLPGVDRRAVTHSLPGRGWDAWQGSLAPRWPLHPEACGCPLGCGTNFPGWAPSPWTHPCLSSAWKRAFPGERRGTGACWGLGTATPRTRGLQRWGRSAEPERPRD